jgi:hypothetical protein
VSSPPPEHNFDEIPEVLDRPHMHGVEGSVHARVTKSYPEEPPNQ